MKGIKSSVSNYKIEWEILRPNFVLRFVTLEKLFCNCYITVKAMSTLYIMSLWLKGQSLRIQSVLYTSKSYKRIFLSGSQSYKYWYNQSWNKVFLFCFVFDIKEYRKHLSTINHTVISGSYYIHIREGCKILYIAPSKQLFQNMHDVTFVIYILW